MKREGDVVSDGETTVYPLTDNGQVLCDIEYSFFFDAVVIPRLPDAAAQLDSVLPVSVNTVLSPSPKRFP